MTETQILGSVREATAADACAILRIYAPHVETSAVSFETHLPSLEEMAGRIETNRKLGWYVYEQDGEVLGYAYASKHRDRAAYQWCCEVSAYVDERSRGKGLATLLYERLLRELKTKGYVNAYAVITLPNERSVSFHEKRGFKSIGVYEKIGFKLGRWHDVGWWALRINEPCDAPVVPAS